MRKISLLLVAALLIAAAAPVYAAPRQQDTVKLKMGLLPILDVLPFFVADEAGYFEEEGLDVELIPVSSALERDQLMLAGEIDGMLNDLVSTGIFNQDKPRIQIVAMSRRAYEDAPQFRILAAPRSNITLPSEAANFEIGISENSVIHYIAQRIMENAGVDAADLKFRPEPNIPVRYQLLMEGSLKVACLPDPLAQAAMVGGAILIADDTALVDEEFSQSVLSFRTGFIEDHPEAVEAFLRVWMHAAEDINADPDAYRDLWLANTQVPDSVKDTYVLPPFPTYAITQPLAWDDTMDWLVAEDIIDTAPGYEDSVNSTFLDAIMPAEDMGAALPGDPANGEVLFAANHCAGCHAVDSDAVLVGPSLMGIADETAEEVTDMSVADFLHQSIVDPSAEVAEGFQDGVMPPYDSLSESEVNDLVAYLMTLE
jgi:NitT/TauT family transport system substrate-binding protein